MPSKKNLEEARSAIFSVPSSFGAPTPKAKEPMRIYGAATLGNGVTYCLSGSKAIDEASGEALNIPHFLEVANVFAVTDIVGSSTLSEDECDWLVVDDGVDIELSSHEEVCDWLATLMAVDVASQPKL